MRDVIDECVQEVQRTAINDILRKHELNGHKREQKEFFRAKEPDMATGH